MSHEISVHRPGDPRRSKVIPCLVAPRFEHRTLIVRAKQHNHSAIAALSEKVLAAHLSSSSFFDNSTHSYMKINNHCLLVYPSCIPQYEPIEN
jgi:hypothetical protein